MNKVLVLFSVAVLFFGCFDVKKVEINQDFQRELDVSKAAKITPAEVSGYAQEIGDSLMSKITYKKDTTYLLGTHWVRIFGKGNQNLSTEKYNQKLEAYAYSLETDPKFKVSGLVNYKSKDSVAFYQNLLILPDTNLKFVLIGVDLAEINYRIVKYRKSLRKKFKQVNVPTT